MNKAIKEFVCDIDVNVMEFLKLKLDSKSKNSIKNFISNNCVYVNDKVCNKANYLLKPFDKVLVILKQIRVSDYVIDIIYEDDYFIGINKPNGLLSVSTKNDSLTAYGIVRDYLKKNNKNNKLFILHRLDRDTSGILLFSKSEKIRDYMQDSWNEIVKERGYRTIVGRINSNQGTIKSYLYEDKNYNVRSTNDIRKGKLAITNYEVLKNSKKYSLLQVFLETGRKNQIRVHMNEIGTSILGDKKYGDLKANRLYLHANVFKFIHPISNELISIVCNDDFNIL